MAVLITQELSEIDVLNAFNNNIAIFNSTDVVSPAISATITVNGVPLSITPDVDGVFTFNFKDTFKTVINQNYFRDGISGSIISNQETPQYVLEDTFVYKEIVVEYKIILENGTIETTSKNYKIMRSVIQLEEHRRNILNSNNADFFMMLPFTSKSSQDYHATYFDGFPFDVAIYSNADRQVTIKNLGTGNTASVNLTRGVNRLFVSNGDSNWSLEDILPMHNGTNKLQFTFTGLPNQNALILHLNKRVQSCGTYLKWFNQSGGWSYYLFNTYQEKRAVKSLGNFGQAFDRIEDTVEQNVNIGMTAQDSINLFYSGVDSHEKQVINTMLESPKIYRLLNDIFQNAQHDDWIAETLKNGNFELYNKNKHIYEDKFSISKSQRNKMSI